MKKNGGSIHTVDVLFPLLFILLFCFCALLVVLQGARIYEKTAAGLEENYTVRTAVSYLQEKVRGVRRCLFDLGAGDGRTAGSGD